MRVEKLAIDGGDPVRQKSLTFSKPVVGQPELNELKDALFSDWLTTAEKTAEFEKRIGDFVGATYATGTTNCTSSLYLTFKALGISGDVILPSMTFVSTASSVKLAGGNPVLVDVEPDTLTINPKHIQEAITEDTEAIVPVHYGGQGARMDVIAEIAHDNSIPIVEDAAPAIGGKFDGQYLGTFGKAGCYSFYPTKPMTTGEGGMVVTDDEALHEQIKRLRTAGVNKDAWMRDRDDSPGWYFDVTDVSGKYNMTDIQASIGLAQLERLQSFIQSRQELANHLDDRLNSLEGITPVSVRDPDEHARYAYPIVLDINSFDLTRNEVAEALTEEGIETSVMYIPIHHHSAYQDVKRGNLEVTEEKFERLLSLPLHPQMNAKDVEDIVTSLEKVITYHYRK